MTHYNFKVKDYKLGAVECFCAHPDLGEDNTCPTGCGECKTCEWCKVTLTCKDFDAIMNSI